MKGCKNKMKSIDDICEVYDVEEVNKDYINNFYSSFDALRFK